MLKKVILIFIIFKSFESFAQNDSVRLAEYNEEQRFDKELQKKYGEIIVYLSESKNKKSVIYKKELIESQNHWKKYIMAQCSLEALPADETPRGSDIFYRECKIEKIKLRLIELDKLYTDLKSLPKN